MASILVVDDEPANLDLLEALLTPAGYRVRTASGAIPALGAVAEERPNLILLDLMMPGMSGFEVCQRLRAHPETAGIQIILVSAAGRLGGEERTQALAADDYLTKPIQPAEVLERVEALLRGQSLQRELERALEDLHALEVGRRAHRGRLLAGMETPWAAASQEAGANPVLVFLQDAEGGRCFSGHLTAEQGEQVVRAASRNQELEARIRQRKAPSGD